MGGLFALADEVAEERAAIREFDGGFSRAEAERLGMLESREWLTACLVRDVASMESFAQRKGFVEEYRRHHGAEAADRLRDALAAERMRRLASGEG